MAAASCRGPQGLAARPDGSIALRNDAEARDKCRGSPRLRAGETPPGPRTRKRPEGRFLRGPLGLSAVPTKPTRRIASVPLAGSGVKGGCWAKCQVRPSVNRKTNSGAGGSGAAR